jgi:cytosine deaminase
VSLASTEAASFVHRAQHDLAVGSRADIVLMDAQNVPDALVRGAQREVVVAGGRVVVDGGQVVI